MSRAELIIQLLKNKTKRLTLAFNPKLWELFSQCARAEGASPTSKIEEMMIAYISKRGKL